jgi:hypothetical protein
MTVCDKGKIGFILNLITLMVFIAEGHNQEDLIIDFCKLFYQMKLFNAPSSNMVSANCIQNVAIKLQFVFSDYWLFYLILFIESPVCFCKCSFCFGLHNFINGCIILALIYWEDNIYLNHSGE